MKDFTPHDFAALIGIDWADQKHDICEQPAGNKPRRLTVIGSRPEAIHDFALDLKQRYPGQLIAVGCELQKVYRLCLRPDDSRPDPRRTHALQHHF